MTQPQTKSTNKRSAWRYEAYDKLEGKVTGQVWAADIDEAEEEAKIAASEQGCSFVEDVAVFSLVDC